MKFYNNSHSKQINLLLVTGDVILVFVAYTLAAVTANVFTHEIFRASTYPIIISLLISPLIFYIFDLYNHDRWKYNVRLLSYIGIAAFIASGIVVLLSYLFVSSAVFNLTIVIIYTLFTILLIFLWRNVFKKLSSKINHIGGKILLIGNGPIMHDITSILDQTNHAPLPNYTAISNYSENPGKVYIDGLPTGKTLFDMVIDDRYSTLVVSEKFSEFPMLKKQLLALRFEGVKIYDAPYFYEELAGKVPVNYIEDTWFLFRNQGGTFNPSFYRKIKKIIDKFLSLFGIFLSAPLMLLIACAIKISSKGPVFFRQDRLGINEKPFTLMKFRTMIENAEKNTGPVWATEDDPRITKVGKFLRKTRLDELPQLFNILTGDMTFVGPRPIRKHMADLLSEKIPHYRYRFAAKPGLTGWAQVKVRYGDTVESQSEKLECDYYYIQNQSILFDLFIVLKTIQTVLFGKGQ